MKRIFPKWHPWTRNKCSQQKSCTLIFVLSRICYKMSLHLYVTHWSSVCSLFLSKAVPSEDTLGDRKGQAGHICTVWFGGNSCEKCFIFEMVLKFCHTVACAQDSVCVLLGKLLFCCGWSFFSSMVVCCVISLLLAQGKQTLQGADLIYIVPLPGTFQRLCKGQWQACQGEVVGTGVLAPDCWGP